MSSSTSRSRSLTSSTLPAVCIIAGALIGLVLAAVVASGTKSSYSASTSYAVLPGTKGSTELGQIGYLTPVFAGRANDPAVKDKVKSELGGKEPAGVTTTTIPGSDLIFTITAVGSDAQGTYQTLQAYEKVLLHMAESGDPVSPTTARLSVSSHAAEPQIPDSLSPKVFYLGGAVAGALVGLALALGLSRRREALSA